MIKQCTCKHEGQDKLHGEGNRVFNQMEEKEGKKEYRCTCCGRVKAKFVLGG